MRTTGVVLAAALVLAGACQKRQTEPEYQISATVKDIMDSMIDPVADVIWNSVATIVTEAGAEERAPRTDEEWAAVRHSAIKLMEATNLLRMRGRAVARPGEKLENPNIELEPEQIQALIENDRATWNRFARDLHDASGEALKAIDARNAKALLDVGERIDSACENCHLAYWYPNQRIPDFPRDLQANEDKPISESTSGGGTIRGHVRLMGKPPGNPIIRMGMDPMCSQMHAGRRVMQETVMADADGSLANVFAVVTGSFPSTPATRAPVVIDQRACVYIPRVIGARVGQPLEIRNDDDLLHDVHVTSAGRNGFHVSQPKAGVVQQVILKDEEIMVRVKCDIHRWMTSYVGVVNHPYFAVSNASGVFQIANVPPGNHKVQIWHERYGLLTQTVRVKPGATVTVEFSYSGEEKPFAAPGSPGGFE